MRIPDNLDIWDAHDIEMERRRARLPQCDYCGEHIQDEYYYEINGEYICEECLNEHFRKENYMEE